MGNYSRDTYDPSKGYTSVRLQQGVPLVDADWNEAADVLRNELYAVNQLLLPDGFPQGSPVLRAFSSGTDNDFVMIAGQFVLGGRLATVPRTGMAFIFPITTYSQQRWTNAAAAAQDGVAVIPPLTTPAAARTDIVYADIWEREVNSTEDPNLINPVIGVETCVRLKRTVAIRVAEGATTPPAAPAGHSFLAFAQFNRAAGNAAIADSMVVDLRIVYATPYGSRTIMLHPSLNPFGYGELAWSNWFGYAFLPSGASYANGYLDLPLPDRSRNVSVGISGSVSAAASIYAYIWQIDQSSTATIVANASYSATASGSFGINLLPASTYISDRTQYSYILTCYASSSSSASVAIYPIAMNYTL